MTDKELKHLSRRELLQLLLEQTERLNELEAKYTEATEALCDRRFRLEKAGSLAEASLALNGVFEAAEAACRQYTENLAALAKKQATLEQEAEEKAAAIIQKARQQAARIEEEAQTQCLALREAAEREARSYWENVNKKLHAFLTEHEELTRILMALPNTGGGACEEQQA